MARKSERKDRAFESVLEAKRALMIKSTAQSLQNATGLRGRKAKMLIQRMAVEEARKKIDIAQHIYQNQRAIYTVLMQYFDENRVKEILDVFSGAALVPLALLHGRMARRIHVVDTHDMGHHYRGLAQRLGNKRADQVNHLRFMVNPVTTRPEMLPASEEVTLVDTGVSLPPLLRAPNISRRSDSPSSHVPSIPLGIDSDQLVVLLKLLDVSRRTIHIVDRPYEVAVDDVKGKIDDRIEQVIGAAGGGWRVSHFSTVPEHNLGSVRLQN